MLLALLLPMLEGHSHWQSSTPDIASNRARTGFAKLVDFPEEERSKQPSPFSLLRALVDEFETAEDSRLVLLGAFGYDLLLQFDPIKLRLPREDAKTLHLFLCDDIYFMDRKKEVIERFQYDFSRPHWYDRGPRRVPPKRFIRSMHATERAEIASDHAAEEYMEKVEAVREGMRLGNYYEVVLRQTFSAPFDASPSELFRAYSEIESKSIRILAADGRRAAGRRLAGDVCAGGGRSGGDVPDCRNGAAVGRSAAGRRKHSRAAEFGERRV